MKTLRLSKHQPQTPTLRHTPQPKNHRQPTTCPRTPSNSTCYASKRCPLLRKRSISLRTSRIRKSRGVWTSFEAQSRKFSPGGSHLWCQGRTEPFSIVLSLNVWMPNIKCSWRWIMICILKSLGRGALENLLPRMQNGWSGVFNSDRRNLALPKSAIISIICCL